MEGASEPEALIIKGLSQPFYVTHSTTSKEFQISIENTVTHLTYAGKFTEKSLGMLGIRMPFEAAYNILEDALKDTATSEISLEGGYLERQGEEKHGDDDLPELESAASHEVKQDAADQYHDLSARPVTLRDSIVLKVTYSVRHFSEIFFYELPVTNYEEAGTIARLTSMLEDRHREIQDLKEKMKQTEEESEKRIQAAEQKLADNFKQLEKDLTARINALPEQKQKEDGPIVGAWQSSAMNATYYRVWNQVTLAPKAEHMILENSNNTVKVLVSGVYRISGVMTSSGASTTHYAAVYINGTVKHYSHNSRTQAQGHYTQLPIDYVTHLNANDKVQIYMGAEPFNAPQYNTLNIQCLK